MRVLAVAEFHLPAGGDAQHGWEEVVAVIRAVEIRGDHRIVPRRMMEHLACECGAGGFSQRSAGGPELFQDRGIFPRVHNHRLVAEILCGRAQHAWPADIDLFHRFGERHAGTCHGLGKRIQVHHHHVDGTDAVFLQLARMIRVVSHGQKRAVNRRMERLDAAVKNLGETCHRRYRFRRNACSLQRRERAAGREDFHPKGVQRGGKFGETFLVGHADQRASNAGHNYSCSG